MSECGGQRPVLDFFLVYLQQWEPIHSRMATQSVLARTSKYHKMHRFLHYLFNYFTVPKLQIDHSSRRSNDDDEPTE
jgi:hypothetical protein